MILPWTRIHSWKCTACGRCCRDYKVPLTYGEYLRFRRLGVVEEKRKYYLKKINGKCPFQTGRYCGIQRRKPFVCKLYPFTIKERGDEIALFEYGNNEYYVYVDTYCKNIITGKPSKSFKRRIVEALEIYTGKRRIPELLTMA
jgi:hypothetical protein